MLGKWFAILAGIMIITVAVTVTGACESNEEEMPTGEAEEIQREYEWRIFASERQRQTIEEFWGEDITFELLLDSVAPEIAEQLPEKVLASADVIFWPSESVDWDLPIVRGFTVTSVDLKPVFNCNATTDGPSSGPKSFRIEYYIGKRSMQILPENVPAPTLYSPPRDEIHYSISIYTGE